MHVLRNDRGFLNRSSIAVFLLALMLTGCAKKPGPAPVVEARPARYSVHLVKKGDTLYSIAFRYQADYKKIARINGIAYPYTIYPGQKLSLGGKSNRYKTRTQQSKTATPQTKKAKSAQSATIAKKSIKIREPEENRPVSAWFWPAKGKITYTYRDSVTGKKGIGITGRLGQSIMATARGRVVYSGSGLIGYGNLIIIKHNQTYLSAYAHNRDLLVKEGDQVIKGQKIAEMGASPNNKPLLHFEIRRNGKPVDPIKLLPSRKG